MSENLYKLKKEMPGHPIGDLVILNDMNIWIFEREPCHKLDQDMLDDKNFFEKIFTNWEKGETIYYIDIYRKILKEEFHPQRHSRLIEGKNGFKNIDIAKNIANKIKNIFDNISKDEIILTREELLNIFAKLEEGNIIAIKNILNKLII